MANKKIRILSYSAKGYFNKEQLISVLTTECKEHGIDLELTFVDGAISPDNLSMVKGYDAISIFVHDNITEEMLYKLEELGCKAIFCKCTGTDMINPAVKNTKINVYNAKSYSPTSIAESALALSLLMVRSTGISIKNQCNNTFVVTESMIGDLISNMTVGVFGVGKIGSKYLDYISGITNSIRYYDPFLKLDSSKIKLYKSRGVDVKSVDTLDELFSSCKLISLHCQLNSNTKNAINAKLINLMEDGSYIVNTARAGLMDPDAVYNALKSGKLRAIGMDTIFNEKSIFTRKFTDEELQKEFPSEYKLSTHPNVFITPHIAFLSKESLVSILDITAQNIIKFITTDSNQ